jgi:hypothetical protein
VGDPQRGADDPPRRAEPLQPDKPGSGRSALPVDSDATNGESPRKAAEQEGSAVDDARESDG